MSNVDAKVSPYLFVAPFFVLFGAIGLFPLLYTAYVSLFDWEVGADEPTFIGLENYRTLFEDDQFWNALFNSFSIFVLSSGPQIVVAVAIAALLNENLRARTGWRMGVLLPYVASLVALTIIFGNLFGPQYGLVNDVLGVLGISPIDWQASTFGSHVAIASMVNWRWTGYNALILLAAMQSIPRDVYESAALDGATKARRFWSITIPMIRPTLIFVVITSTIGGLQIFTEPKLFDGRNRVFFMSNFEGFKSRRSTPQFSTMMTPEMRRGDFSAVSTPLQDPATRVRVPNANGSGCTRMSPVKSTRSRGR